MSPSRFLCDLPRAFAGEGSRYEDPEGAAEANRGRHRAAALQRCCRRLPWSGAPGRPEVARGGVCGRLPRGCARRLAAGRFANRMLLLNMFSLLSLSLYFVLSLSLSRALPLSLSLRRSRIVWRGLRSGSYLSGVSVKHDAGNIPEHELLEDIGIASEL